MQKFMIISRPDPASTLMHENLEEELCDNGYELDKASPDIIFVIGGDGTFIYAVHYALRKLEIDLNKTCFYGIHTGTLGFYSDFKDTEYREYVNAFFNQRYTEVSYPLLQVSYRENQHNAINEIRIENAARTQKIEVSLNGRYFETFRGSGLCVCTQLGSTAYNRSLGGAVIQEGLNFIELTEIAGIHHCKAHSLDAPLVLKSDTVIEFRADSFEGALLGCDSNVYPLDDVHSMSIAIRKTASVRTLRGKDISYFDRLKSLFDEHV